VLIRRHDAALDDDEWRAFLGSRDFGELVAGGHGRDVPVIVPTHFIYDGQETIRLHLAAPNPVWSAIEENPTVVMSVFDAYTYVPTQWNANADAPIEYGVPTSYYAAVQAICEATVIDDAAALTAILRRQLEHFQPEGGHAPVEPGDNRYARLLPGIRGLELRMREVHAKFKFGGNKSTDQRGTIAAHLAERARGNDLSARAHLLRRLAAERGVNAKS
jgi:transcriptional regulator